MDAAELALPSSKTGPRKVSLSPRAVRVLKGIERVPGNPWVMPGRIERRPMRNINEAWGVICELAGLEDTRIHDCRHSFAPRALALGENLTIIGRLHGHSELQATKRYAHLDRDWVREAAVRISESIASDILPGCAGAEAVALQTAHPTTLEKEEGTSMRHRVALLRARSARAA